MNPKRTRDDAGLYNFRPSRHGVDVHAPYVADRTIVDEHTLTITTIDPFALLPKVLTYPVFSPVAPE